MSKSFLDNIFDAADAALNPLEKVLAKDPPASQKQAPIDVEPDDERHDDWEKGFATVQWATVNGKEAEYTWHAFREGSMRTLCGKDCEITHNRKVLEHGKTISACTSCIIAVSK